MERISVGLMFSFRMKREALLALFLCLFVAPLCSGQAQPQTGTDTPVALVGNEPIYERDLMSVAGPNLLDLRRQEYKVESDALNQCIRKKLIEVEAKKKGLSSEELLKQQVDSKITEPTDDEAKGYYLGVKNQNTLPFDQIKTQVKQLLKQAEIELAREKYADSLRDKAAVSILIQPPAVHVNYDPARVTGDPDAPITIVEFADFQCPFCSRVEPLLKDVLSKYKGKAKLAYLDFPLAPIHSHAEAAAEASRCALAQGKYWEMHDAMFADQSKLDEASLVKTAERLGMDQNSFESCLNSGKYKKLVQKDVEAGSEAGVNATPTFFVNGELIGGVQSDADFEKIIDRQLSAMQVKDSRRASHPTKTSEPPKL